MRTIEHMEQCNAAAHDLGLVDTSAHPFQGYKVANGCAYSDNDFLLWHSPIGATYESVPCGAISGGHAYDCICATQGINEQSRFVLYGTFKVVHITPKYVVQ